MKRSRLCVLTIAASILSNPPLHKGGTVSEEAEQTLVPVVRAEATGTLTGLVKLDGPAPKGKPINMAKEPICVKAHPTPPLTEEVVAGANGTLQNAIVYISEGVPNSTFDPPSDPVVIEQKGCQFHPHVVALQSNQKLQVVNSDPIVSKTTTIAVTQVITFKSAEFTCLPISSRLFTSKSMKTRTNGSNMPLSTCDKTMTRTTGKSGMRTTPAPRMIRVVYSQ